VRSSTPIAYDVSGQRRRLVKPQALDCLTSCCNQLYAGIVDVTEYGIRAKRGDFEALISEDLFYTPASSKNSRDSIVCRGGGRAAGSQLVWKCERAGASEPPERSGARGPRERRA
jgi:hypothetical protein